MQGGFISEAERVPALLAHVVTRAVEPRVTQVEHVLHQLIERGAVRADIVARFEAVTLCGWMIDERWSSRTQCFAGHTSL
ncbi:hypothetical protein D7D52_36710 [Nocardia yunnanensis]|uniref:Uncharacterized protein n=1 Tax=Nocardia yunnanensis TaxID=2382165 RepID=A0A386ZLF9_9NOCA|nr:hypothetical protein D7D52_36710 [Nocardia yunnanensis]